MLVKHTHNISMWHNPPLFLLYLLCHSVSCALHTVSYCNQSLTNPLFCSFMMSKKSRPGSGRIFDLFVNILSHSFISSQMSGSKFERQMMSYTLYGIKDCYIFLFSNTFSLGVSFTIGLYCTCKISAVWYIWGAEV